MSCVDPLSPLIWADVLYPDIDDSEGNANRVMLIGTAILTTIDLIDKGLFGTHSEIRNIGFIIGLFLEFAVVFEETCTTNEDGWRFVVVKKVDQNDVVILGHKRMELVMRQVRMDMDYEDNKEEEEEEEEEENSEKAEEPDNRPNFVKAYKPTPYDPQALLSGVTRLWDAWDWKLEVLSIFAHISLFLTSNKVSRIPDP